MKEFILWISIFMLYNCSIVSSQCHIDDWTALKALYESTNGDNWEKIEGWEQIKSDTPPLNCDLSKMHGVTLDEDYGERVEDLFLPGNNLVGTIPEEICKLKLLKDFSLDINRLSGNIPTCLGSLTELNYLGFEFNQLTGSIPKEIGNLCNLGWLALRSNQLSGEIPPELGNLKSIYRLILSGNELTGEIPPELVKNGYVYVLGLDANQLTGSIPPEFGNINFDWSTLYLWGNNLSGCHDVNLLNLCDNFNSPYGFISPVDDEEFDVTWEEFCFEDKGICDTTKLMPLVGTFNCD